MSSSMQMIIVGPITVRNSCTLTAVHCRTVHKMCTTTAALTALQALERKLKVIQRPPAICLLVQR